MSLPVSFSFRGKRALFEFLFGESLIAQAMFTSFRCFTDGCAAFDGTPLQDLGRGAGSVCNTFRGPKKKGTSKRSLS